MTRVRHALAAPRASGPRRVPRAFAWLATLATVAAGLALPPSSPAAPGQLTIDVPTLVGFKAPIHEDNRLVALVAGKEAKPSLLAGEVQITEFRLETYRYAPNQQTELVVESPLGTFGSTGASSDRPITLRSADGRFAISGQGWSWNRDTGLLTISNRVQTALRRDPKATNRPPIEVASATFRYNLRSGDARFLGDCVATQPGHAVIRAGELSSRLSSRSERPDTIVATNGVALELLRPGHQGRATGSGGLYAVTEDGERITLSGPATWAFGPAQGSADELVLEPAKESYHAHGHTRLRLADLPRPATANAAAAPAPTPTPTPTPASVPGTNRPPVEITAEAIDSTPGRLVFTGPVVATQPGRLALRANQVTATLKPDAGPSRESVERVLATGDVEATLQGRTESIRLRGREMTFTGGEHELIEVRGDPAWEAGTYSGTAERFVIHPEVPTFQALNAVSVRWLPPRGAATNAPPILLTADRLVAELGEARFSGQVRARHELWELRAAELDLRLATNAALREIAARQDVELDYHLPLLRLRTNAPATTRSDRGFVASLQSNLPGARLWRVRAAEVTAAPSPDGRDFDRLDASGGVRIDNPAASAAGGRLVYRATDGLLRLTEQAWLKTIDGLHVAGQPATVIGFDPASGRFVVEGPVRRMTLPSLALQTSAATNRPAAR